MPALNFHVRASLQTNLCRTNNASEAFSVVHNVYAVYCIGKSSLLTLLTQMAQTSRILLMRITFTNLIYLFESDFCTYPTTCASTKSLLMPCKYYYYVLLSFCFQPQATHHVPLTISNDFCMYLDSVFCDRMNNSRFVVFIILFRFVNYSKIHVVVVR